MSVNHYTAAWQQFKGATAEHQMTVLHDDGLYRHIRMAKPGTGIWAWNIVTWPGSLAITGDIGRPGIFTCESDMIEFFAMGLKYGNCDNGSPAISFDYWAEKFSGEPKRYSSEKFMRMVRAALEESNSQAHIQPFLDDAEDVSENERKARAWLEAEWRMVGDDAWWEWDLTDLDHHFLLGCYAVAKTVRAYLDRVES